MDECGRAEGEQALTLVNVSCADSPRTQSYAATVATEKADAVAAAEDAELDATMQEAAENDDKDGDYLQIVDENGDEEEIDMPWVTQLP